MPGACYIEMARQGGDLIKEGYRVKRLLNNYWIKQLSSEAEDFKAYLDFSVSGSHYDYKVTSESACAETLLHAMGQVELEPMSGIKETAPEKIDFLAIRKRCDQKRYPKEIYPQIIAEGLHVGPTFMPMVEIVLNEQEALAHLQLPGSIEETASDYVLHPTMLTGFFQTALINNRYHAGDPARYIPIGIDELELLAPLSQKAFYVYSTIIPVPKEGSSVRKFNICVCDSEGVVCWKLKGFSLKALKAQETNAAQNTSLKQTQQTTVDMESEMQEEGQLQEAACNYLKELLSEAIGLSPAEIKNEELLESYGINSMMIVTLNGLLEKEFGALSKTLLFEYQNIEELAEYFLDNHKTTLLEKAQYNPPKKEQSKEVIKPEGSIQPPEAPKPLPPIIEKDPEKAVKKETAIAIVGLGGRYPKAKTMAAFWEVLKSGQDCIEEIPESRFDYKKYFNEDKDEQLIYSKWGSFIDDIDQFDPLFFNI